MPATTWFGWRLAFLLSDLPVQLLARIRSDRVSMPRRPAPPARPSRHGPAMKLNDPSTWPVPAQCQCR
jgi:hypothetical protein